MGLPLLICLMLLISLSAAQPAASSMIAIPQCSPNEFWYGCGRNPCVATCDRGAIPGCVFQCNAQRAACVCREGYIRNSLDQCVLPNLCKNSNPTPPPVCPPNEFWSQCGRNPCVATCDKAASPGCVFQCNAQPAACVCKQDYFRNSMGQCVTWNQCHSSDSSCVDRSTNCAYWASNGECFKKPGYMLQNCRLSCADECSNSKPFCNDDPDFPRCQEWANKGECSTNPNFMLLYCRFSCGKCIPPPRPMSSVVAGGSATGPSESGPAYRQRYLWKRLRQEQQLNAALKKWFLSAEFVKRILTWRIF